ncbi:MAG: YtxH domain-containing protein [Desulfuromonadaceae bacterium]|nr:YtxH domain-containing protein [Desulfuromonadaceae bacterium]MDD2856849.1 YtxH domain-containing protein [Desulfuromonadaceae bacterium]
MEDRDRKIAATALLLFAGGVIGAGVALFFAPTSGVRTRKKLLRYSKQVRRTADDAVQDLSDNVSTLVEAIAEKGDDLLEKGKDAADSSRRDLIRLIEEGAARLEKIRTILKRF